MRRGRFLLAVVLIAGAAAVSGWFYHRRLRVITVCVFTDPAFRERAGWHKVLNTRLEAVNRIYERQVGILWKVIDTRSPDPTVDLANLDDRRADLAQNTYCRADLILSITGLKEGGRTGSVSPFSHGAIVVDKPKQTESQNTLILAHELAHLFGAVHDPGADTLMSAKPVSARFSSRTAKLIHSLRDYNFARGVKALGGSWGKRVVAALSEELRGLSANPGAQAQQIVAAALAADGEASAAITHLRAAVRGDPKNVQTRFDLAVALERNSQDDAALKTLREGVRLNPGSARLHSALGAAILKSDREEAIDEFMTSLRLNPNNARLYAILGAVLSSGMGQIDAAITAYRNALKLDPGMVQAREGLARALASKTQAEKDVAAARRAAARNPENPETTYNLGVAEARAGNFEAAAKAFQTSVRLRPRFGRAHSSLALIFYLSGDYAAAWKQVNAARAAGFEPAAPFLAALSRKMPLPAARAH